MSQLVIVQPNLSAPPLAPPLAPRPTAAPPLSAPPPAPPAPLAPLASPASLSLAPSSPETLARLREVESLILACPQVEVLTEHLLHGGMYARTIRRGPGIVATGSLILRATILIVNGPCTLLTGDRRLDLTGYNVLPGLAGRKQLSLTHGDVEMTMIFPTSASTVEEAENEIFAEADQLLSRRTGENDMVTITGR